MLKILHVRKIGIDNVPDGDPFVEMRIDLHMVQAGKSTQIISDYKRIYKRISELSPIPVGSIADDGVIDNVELMNLVGTAALMWVAREFDGTFDEYGRVIIQ